MKTTLVILAPLLTLAAAGCTLEVNESPSNRPYDGVATGARTEIRPFSGENATTRGSGAYDFEMNMTPGSAAEERVRVHFRRDIMGAEGPVGLSLPGRGLDTFTIVGTLVSRGDTWVRLTTDAGRTVDIPTAHVLAILSDPDLDEPSQ